MPHASVCLPPQREGDQPPAGWLVEGKLTRCTPGHLQQRNFRLMRKKVPTAYAAALRNRQGSDRQAASSGWREREGASDMEASSLAYGSRPHSALPTSSFRASRESAFLEYRVRGAISVSASATTS